MARPERNNVDYFPFFCEEGNKMYYIEETYGNDGFATFIKILRELAKANYHYLDLSKPTTVMFLSAKCKISKEILLAIIKDLVDLGKFDSILWEENKIIWCQDFVDSIQDAYFKRKNKCISLEGLIQLLISLGVRKQSKLQTIVPVNTQSKVEETILNESKEDLDSRKLKFASTLQPFFKTYGKDLLNDFYAYWTEPNKSKTKFKQELEKTWDLERRLNTWAKNDKNFQKEKSSAQKEKDPDEQKLGRMTIANAEKTFNSFANVKIPGQNIPNHGE